MSTANEPDDENRSKQRVSKGILRKTIWVTAGLLLIVVGLWCVHRHQTSVDRQLIKKLEQHGALVGGPKYIPRFINNYAPRWVIGLWPEGNLTGIAFFGPRPTDDVLYESIVHFQTIEQLRLSDTAVTDAILDPISKLPRLQLLWLERTAVTDEGLATLASNSWVSHVFLDDTAVTDAGVKPLTSMKRLDSLSLAGTKVTDAAVDDLLKIPRLRLLDVTDTAISPAGLERLESSGRIELCTGLSSR